MATIEDKLKLFTKIVFDKVEKEAEDNLSRFNERLEQEYKQQRDAAQRLYLDMVNETRKKAELKKIQIVSKAKVDAQHIILKKKKELLDRTLGDIRQLALEYTKTREYLHFLERCIKDTLIEMEGCKHLIFYFSKRDVDERYRMVSEVISANIDKDTEFSIQPAQDNIIGGCICQDRDGLRRIDNSMASMLEDNRAMIGKTLMENLQ
ncbi:MAG TPA: hypothetical protein GXZ32_08670 [Clostridiales bacterium]|nr:hypothetical protein [Clostridiales bacterium]